MRFIVLRRGRSSRSSRENEDVRASSEVGEEEEESRGAAHNRRSGDEDDSSPTSSPSSSPRRSLRTAGRWESSEERSDDLREFSSPSDRDVTLCSSIQGEPALLQEALLSPPEFESKLKTGIRIRSSIVPGRTYVLRLGRRIKVLDGGNERPKYLCVGTLGKCKSELDEAIALYLNLILNEKELLRVANVMKYDTLPAVGADFGVEDVLVRVDEREERAEEVRRPVFRRLS